MSKPAWALAGAVLGALVAGLWSARRRRLEARYFSFALHELNTPLTALHMTVMNFVQGVFGDIPDEQKPWFGMLRSESSRLQALVGDMRDFVHLEFHRDFSIHLEEDDLSERLSSAVEAHQPGFDRAKISLEYAKPAAAVRGLIDRDRFYRLVFGLIDHAKKFRAHGPVRLELRLGAAGPEVELSYAGPVEHAAEMRGALELYAVARRSGETLCGVGLGLGFSRLLAESGGGKLDMRVADDGATRFLLKLPAAPAVPS